MKGFDSIMIKISVVGATGYAGAELVRILSKHPEAEIVHLVSKSYAGQKMSDIYESFMNICDIKLEGMDVNKIASDSDVVFTALPHGASKEIIPAIAEKGVKIIDFSADYRYKDPEIYKQWYGTEHGSPQLLGKSVYGLCELYRNEIAGAAIIGNPGCYTTCSILALAPLVENKLIDFKSIVIDAKSGVTGAGRSEALDYSFCECTENMKAYKIAKHRHTSEIEQELSALAGEEIVLSFTPHLIPLKRGVLATCYAELRDKSYSAQQLIDLYKSYYKDDYFIRIYDCGKLPETHHVAGSNFVDMGLAVDERTGRVIVVSCIDNIVKGAAGQAVQNMNIMFGLPESMGIDNPAFYL